MHQSKIPLALSIFASLGGLMAQEVRTNIPVDAYGDPLPSGAIARMGTARLRHGHVVTCLAYTPDGGTLTRGGLDGAIMRWDVATGKRLSLCDVEGEFVHAIAISPDGNLLASGHNVLLRSAAHEYLEAIALEAEALLREALEAKPSAEAGLRLQALLLPLEGPLVESRPLLRCLRAIWALEQIGTVEAEKLLEALAAGPASRRRSPEAGAALEQLNSWSASNRR